MDIKNQISFVNIDWTKRVMKEGRSVYFSEWWIIVQHFVCIHRSVPLSSSFLRGRGYM
jgi:hypothetical protein